MTVNPLRTTNSSMRLFCMLTNPMLFYWGSGMSHREPEPEGHREADDICRTPHAEDVEYVLSIPVTSVQYDHAKRLALTLSPMILVPILGVAS